MASHGIMTPQFSITTKDLFDAAGVDYPDGTWTWTEFLDAAQKLTVRDERGGLPSTAWSWRATNTSTSSTKTGADIFDDNLNPTRFTLTILRPSKPCSSWAT